MPRNRPPGSIPHSAIVVDEKLRLARRNIKLALILVFLVFIAFCICGCLSLVSLFDFEETQSSSLFIGHLRGLI